MAGLFRIAMLVFIAVLSRSYACSYEGAAPQPLGLSSIRSHSGDQRDIGFSLGDPPQIRPFIRAILIFAKPPRQWNNRWNPEPSTP